VQARHCGVLERGHDVAEAEQVAERVEEVQGAVEEAHDELEPVAGVLAEDDRERQEERAGLVALEDVVADGRALRQGEQLEAREDAQAEVEVEAEQLQVLVGQALGQVEARRAADAPAALAAAGEARSGRVCRGTCWRS